MFAAAWPRAPSGPLSAPTTAFTAFSRSNALAAALAASLAGVGGADERGVAAGVLSKAAPGATRTGGGGCTSCVLGGALPLGCRSGRGGCACGCGFACAGVLRRETRRECGDGARWWGAEVVGVKHAPATGTQVTPATLPAPAAPCSARCSNALVTATRRTAGGRRPCAYWGFTLLLPRASANPSHNCREKHRASQAHTSRRLHAGRLFGAGERVKRTEQDISPRDPPPTACLASARARTLYTKRERTHRLCCLQHT